MVHHVFLDPRLVKTSIAPEPVRLGGNCCGADDRVRTGDLNLGKVAL